MAADCPVCPFCGGARSAKAGKDRAGRQRWRCKACGKIYTLEPKYCAVCGQEIPAARKLSNTCSDACKAARVKETQLNHYYRKALNDPDFHRKNYLQAKARPGYAERAQKSDARKWKKIKNDPERYEKERERLRRWYAENRVRVQAERRERLKNMSDAERAQWLLRVRESGRRYRARWQEEIEQHPEKHQQYLDKQAEYRRQRKLAELLALAKNLEEKLDD